jgi:tetratricopeptide (TPR) repeat protein
VDQCSSIPRRQPKTSFFVRVMPLAAETSTGELATKHLLWSFFTCPQINLGLPGNLIFSFVFRVACQRRGCLNFPLSLARRRGGKSGVLNFLPTELLNNFARMNTSVLNSNKSSDMSGSFQSSADHARSYGGAGTTEDSLDSNLIVHDFMTWVQSIEQLCIDLQINLTHVTNEGNSQGVREVSEALVLMEEIVEDISTFFMQIRVSNLIPHLMPILKSAWSHYLNCRSMDNSVVDTRFLHSCNLFISHCFSQHTSRAVKMHMEMADDAHTDREYDKAISYIDNAIILDNTYVEAYVKRATASFAKEDIVNSMRYLDSALSICPHHFRAICGKAIIMMKLRSFKAAYALLLKVLELNPTQQESLSRRILKCQREIRLEELERANN